MVDKKTWKEFKDTGLLWFINNILHLFGWAICLEMDGGAVTEAYPARTKFRGFSEDCNSEGYKKVTQYMKDNAKILFLEAQE